MNNRFFEIGGGTYVNGDEVELIMSASIKKANSICEKYGIKKDSQQLVNATSNEETKAILFMKSGRLVLSCMKLPLLVKRANKDFSSIKEATDKPAKAKSASPKEKIFVNKNPLPSEPKPNFINENLHEYDMEDGYEENGFMSILDE